LGACAKQHSSCAAGCALARWIVVALARAPPHPSSRGDGVALRDRCPTAVPQFHALVVMVVAGAETVETLLCIHLQRACGRSHCSQTSSTFTLDADTCYFSRLWTNQRATARHTFVSPRPLPQPAPIRWPRWQRSAEAAASQGTLPPLHHQPLRPPSLACQPAQGWPPHARSRG